MSNRTTCLPAFLVLVSMALSLAACGGGGGGGGGDNAGGGDNGGGGNNAAPSLLVFTTDRNGNDEIFRMNEDGTGQQNLTNDPARDDQPALSRDGTKIAFASNRNGNNEIYIMNSDGSGVTNLTNTVDIETLPAFSPDGTQIAFTSTRAPAGIYTMNADGTNQTLRSGSVGGFAPTWSPDGTKILFTSLTRNTAGVDSREIFTVGADGQGLVNLTESNRTDTMPSFSPDGSRIVFMTTRDLFGSEIYIMNLDGSNPTRLTGDAANVAFPRFSPNGSLIVFTSDRDGFPDVHLMNANGTGRVPLTNGESLDQRPQFTRDGTGIIHEQGSPTLFPNSSLILRGLDGIFRLNLTISSPGVDDQLVLN